MIEFEGKTAVITGGASGIGYAIAERCVKEGMNIVLADIEEKALAKAKSEFQNTGASVLTIKTDVSKAQDIEELAKKTIETFGQVHLLFNNAGVGTTGTIWEYSEADWKWVLGVNLWGVIYGVRVFTPIMLEQRNECHIINTASSAGLDYNTYMGAYGISKYGVVTLSESLYLELMGIGAKVRVSVLCPGIVNTRLMESDRNRPIIDHDDVTSVSDQAKEKWNLLKGLMSSERSLPMEDLVDQVFDAIRNERLYIVTHKHTFAEIDKRMNNILLQKNPTL